LANDRKGGSFRLGLLAGGLLGFALALLLAPDRGEETRSRVRSRVEPWAERARDTVGRAATGAVRSEEVEQETED
jgi:gas vesicle protein